MKKKIKSFTDLIAWQKGHELVLVVYELTGRFPKQEVYALTGQMRRAVVSVTSNIAEGFSRRTQKEKTQFYFMALGSLTELQNQLLAAKDVGYLAQKEFDQAAGRTVEAGKLINGLIRSIRNVQS